MSIASALNRPLPPGVMSAYVLAGQYLQFAMPPRTLPPGLAGGYPIVMETVERIQNLLWFIEGSHEMALPLFVIDGPSAVGKTTLMPPLQQALRNEGHKVMMFSLDMFLKEPAWRKAEVQSALDGDRDLDAYDEIVMWDSDRIISELLFPLDSFWRSGRPTGQLTIHNAFDASAKAYRDMTFVLHRTMIIMIEGKYAHHPSLRSHYGERTFRVRIQDDPASIRDRFFSRPSRTFKSDEDRRRAYDTIFWPSYERYVSATRNEVIGVLSHNSDDFMD